MWARGFEPATHNIYARDLLCVIHCINTRLRPLHGLPTTFTPRLWSYDHMTLCYAVGGQGRPNRSTVWTIFGNHPVLSLYARWECVPGSCTYCRTRGSKEGGRLQRRLSSSFFDRFRCRQSLDRGFGTLRSHWSSNFVDLSTVRLIFKHFEKFNIKDPFGDWTRRCSPEWGELLYQVAVFMSYVQSFLMLSMLIST
jgi:hypothetical protein